MGGQYGGGQYGGGGQYRGALTRPHAFLLCVRALRALLRACVRALRVWESAWVCGQVHGCPHMVRVRVRPTDREVNRNLTSLHRIDRSDPDIHD
jgi:hypothetical protein